MTKKEYARKWLTAHLDKVKEYRQTYYKKNKERILNHSKIYQKEHPEISRRATAARYLRLKNEVLTHYGNGKLACVRCGFNNMGALSIDHLDGGGHQFRVENKLTSTYDFYGWLKKKGYPKGYQTLCMNCQFIKRVENRENYIGHIQHIHIP